MDEDVRRMFEKLIRGMTIFEPSERVQANELASSNGPCLLDVTSVFFPACLEYRVAVT